MRRWGVEALSWWGGAVELLVLLVSAMLWCWFQPLEVLGVHRTVQASGVRLREGVGLRKSQARAERIVAPCAPLVRPMAQGFPTLFFVEAGSKAPGTAAGQG